MILDPDDPRRKSVGLVYLDEASPPGPATHVLIVGVGAYRSPKLKRPLTTTTVSARALADWFVGPAKPGFVNADCPLGSLAILLSEPAEAPGAGPADDRSAYAGGPVPRADFAGVKAAVRAWVERMNVDKDNLAVLYIASHGESHFSNTAFLLEDHGLDALDATAGMSQMEQLVGALENAAPVSQLLMFDCCRTPSDAGLSLQTNFGTPLVNLARGLDDHGERRKQCRIAASCLGEVAIGRAGRPTFFMEALLASLGGVASEPTRGGWPVRPGNLVDKIDLLMSLQRLADESAQVPSSQLTGSFEITFPGEPTDVPVYVAFDDPADWPDSEITVAATPGEGATILCREGEPPFGMIRVPVAAQIRVDARRGGAIHGQAEGKAFAPAMFLEIGKARPPAPDIVGRLDTGRSFGKQARIVLRLDGALSIAAGAVADIVRRDDPAKNPKSVTVPIGGEVEVDVRPGEHLITLRTPDGRVETRDVAVAPDDILKVSFAMPASPHEWLATAAMTGSIRKASAEVATRAPPPPAPSPAPSPQDMRQWRLDRFQAAARRPGDLAKFERGGAGSAPFSLPDLDFDVDIPAAAGAEPPPAIRSDVSCHVDVSLERRSPARPMLDTTERQDDGMLVRLDFVDLAPERFAAHLEEGLRRPLFALVEGEGRRELAAIPSLGLSGSATRGGWAPYILANRRAPAGAALSSVIVDDAIWGALLGFLASRNFEAAGRLLAGPLADAAAEAMGEEGANPLAALAGALVAVADPQTDLERRWDAWLESLAHRFPDLPDGPIVLGRRRLLAARTQAEVAEARRRLFEGFDRGVPVFSLSADWLARGLDSLPGEDPDLVQRRTLARQLAGRVDPAQAFTVIRIDD